MVRRLPVLQNKDVEDGAAEERPAWHWVLIGLSFVVTLFLPLSTLGVWSGARLAARAGSPAAAAFAGAAPVLVAFALSAWSSGALVGRFSGRPTARVAMLGGALGGAGIFTLAAVAGALRPLPVALAAFAMLAGTGALFATLGARFGRRSKSRAGVTR